MSSVAVVAPAFEIDRFELVGDDRLEVAGRWFGVRGGRFVRPTLTVGGRRLLALLEDKPWDAEDGEPWIAAFAWDGGPLEAADAELAVGPGLSVGLAAPAGSIEPT